MVEVSVIIPNYNHAAFLRKRIDSVLMQTFQNFELILLDDCSSDDSREIISQYETHEKVSHIVFNSENSGSPFVQWQKGISLATGSYIWIAESDDYADPHFLETVYSLALQNENIGIAFCNSNWVDYEGQVGKSLSLYRESFVRSGDEEILTLLKYNTIQNASAAIIRRDLALSCVDGIEKFRSCGDWLFYIRVLSSSNLVYTNEVLNSFRWYHLNTSSKALSNDWWIEEGIEILTLVDLRVIRISKRVLNGLFIFWINRIRNSILLPFQVKLVCLGQLLKFFLKWRLQL